jgi:hypothetical protein
MDVDDIVFLVPGFLGFDHFGGFPYFSQGVAAALQVALDAQTEGKARAVVESVGTVPTGSLKERQTKLVSEIRRVLDEHGVEQPDFPRIHLVGHSTGALDSELLVSQRSLDEGGQWSAEASRIRPHIRSVIEIAPPTGGTGLVLSKGIALLADGVIQDIANVFLRPWEIFREAEGLAELGRLTEAAFSLGLSNDLVGQILANGAYDRHPLLKFLSSVTRDRALLRDLRPAAVSQTLRQAGGVPTGGDPLIKRYVTIARREPSQDASGQLFRELHGLCLEGIRKDGEAHDRAAEAAEALQALDKDAWISSSSEELNISAEANDGVVNTGLQVPWKDNGPDLSQVAAIVVADHLDVVGGFPMFTGPDAPANSFLTSGSAFRAPEFSRLYRKIAKDIAGIMPERR